MCFCGDIGRAVPQAARAVLCCVILVVFPRVFVFWQPECGGDIPSDGGGKEMMVEEPLSGEVTRHNCKMCIVQDFSKRLQKWRNMARKKRKGRSLM